MWSSASVSSAVHRNNHQDAKDAKKTYSTMKAADLSQPVARQREGKVCWCKSAVMIFNGDIQPNKKGGRKASAADFSATACGHPGF